MPRVSGTRSVLPLRDNPLQAGAQACLKTTTPSTILAAAFLLSGGLGMTSRRRDVRNFLTSFGPAHGPMGGSFRRGPIHCLPRRGGYGSLKDGLPKLAAAFPLSGSGLRV
jgi:hypothetical protein